MYCWPYHLKVWQGHGPTGPNDSALHGIVVMYTIRFREANMNEKCLRFHKNKNWGGDQAPLADMGASPMPMDIEVDDH